MRKELWLSCLEALRVHNHRMVKKGPFKDETQSNKAEDVKSRSNAVTDTSEGALRKVPCKGRDDTCTTQTH